MALSNVLRVESINLVAYSIHLVSVTGVSRYEFDSFSKFNFLYTSTYMQHAYNIIVCFISLIMVSKSKYRGRD